MNSCFNCLPFAAIISNKIFCVAGGLSSELQHIDQIHSISRPTDIPDYGLICDLLWGDPDVNCVGWNDNDCGVSFKFGPDVVHRFLEKSGFELVCRSSSVVEGGYEYFAGGKLVTIFSATNYCGEFCNAGAIMNVDERMNCSFQVFQPVNNL